MPGRAGALLVMQPGPSLRFVLRRGKQWPAEPKLAERRLVAREGSAPSISGCRPDVILFHHRALLVWNWECRAQNGILPARKAWVLWHSSLCHHHSALRLAAGDGFAPPRSPSKGDVLLLDDPAGEKADF